MPRRSIDFDVRYVCCSRIAVVNGNESADVDKHFFKEHMIMKTEALLGTATGRLLAAAVLVASIGALCVAAAFLYEKFG